MVFFATALVCDGVAGRASLRGDYGLRGGLGNHQRRTRAAIGIVRFDLQVMGIVDAALPWSLNGDRRFWLRVQHKSWEHVTYAWRGYRHGLGMSRPTSALACVGNRSSSCEDDGG